MTSRLGVVLESAMKLPGVVAAALADSEGCVVESASWLEDDLAASGTAASQMLKRWASVGTDLGIGTLQSMLIERVGGPATITPLGQDAVLLVVGNRSCRPGRLRHQAMRARAVMHEVGRMVSEPNISAPLQISDRPRQSHGDDRGGPPPQPPRLTTGEIVLVGAHTFRLVTKLIAQLLQLKGVRTSRLRAYSPSTTVIDVLMEDGATLGTIDGTRLEEFSIERAEEGGTRLILRPARALGISPARIGSPG